MRAGKRWGLAVLLLSGCVSQPQLPPDPHALGFGAYTLGMSADALPKSFTCSKDEIDVDLSCLASRRIDDALAGHPADELLLGFFGGRLHQIAAQTQKAYYADIVAWLTQKHGAPRVSAAPYTEASGAVLSGKTSSWNLPQGTIKAVEYCTPLISCVSYQSSGYAALAEKKRQSASR